MMMTTTTKKSLTHRTGNQTATRTFPSVGRGGSGGLTGALWSCFYSHGMANTHNSFSLSARVTRGHKPISETAEKRKRLPILFCAVLLEPTLACPGVAKQDWMPLGIEL